MIEDLAPKYGYESAQINIHVIGSKPGEKPYEELMNHEETRRAIELPKYFSALPAFRGYYELVSYNYENIISNKVDNPYISSDEDSLDKEQIREFLTKNSLVQTNSY